METKTIAQKLLEFQCSVDTIKKDGKNPHFKSTYATLPHILAEVKPILNALKIVVTQPISGNEVFTILTDTDSGETVNSSITLPAGLSAQQAGSAITYYRRYTLSSLLALEIDEDDDGNMASRPAKQELPLLTKGSKAYTQAVEKLRAGTLTIEKLETAFTLNGIKQDLINESKKQTA